MDAGEGCGLGAGTIKSTGLFSLDLLLNGEVKENFRFQEEEEEEGGLSCVAAEALANGQGQGASWTVSLVPSHLQHVIELRGGFLRTRIGVGLGSDHPVCGVLPREVFR